MKRAYLRRPGLGPTLTVALLRLRLAFCPGQHNRSLLIDALKPFKKGRFVKYFWSIIFVFSAQVAMAETALPNFDKDLLSYEQLSTEQKAAIGRGEIVRFRRDLGDLEGAQAFMLLPQPITDVWNLLLDYPTFKTWMYGVVDITEITWLSPEVANVGYVIDSPIQNVSYLLQRTHKKHERIRWHRLSGDLDAVYGGYDLQSLSGGTLVGYWSLVDIGVWIPANIKAFFTVKGLHKLMESIRAEADRRAKAVGQKIP